MSNRFDDIPEEELEQFRRVGKRMQQKSLPYLKWGATNIDKEITFRLKGKNMQHSQWIAQADEVAACYVHFVGKVCLGRGPTVVILRNGLPPEPADNFDKTKWVDGDYGKRKPWQLQYEIALQHPETGDQVLFSSTTEWGRNAIGATIEYFTNTRRRPIVQLEKREIIDGSKTIIIGALDIVRSDEGDEDNVDLTKDAVVNASTTNGSGAMDDNYFKRLEDDLEDQTSDLKDNDPF